MANVEAYRELVVARAGGVCEYCRLVQAATGVTFHIEHFLPRSQGGQTAMTNLVLSCPGCNLAKAERTSGPDSNGKTQPFFNPREFDPGSLGWHLHFTMDRESGTIVGRTPIGEATVLALRMNDAIGIFARKLQILAGLIG
jgi:hypothetical protein